VLRADRIAGAALLVFAVAFSAGALRHYTYWGPGGPGSGFLPFWLGLAMGGLALMLLVGATRSRGAGAPWLPAGEGLRRLAVVLAVTVAFVALLNVVGMLLGTALFLVALLRFLEGYSWRLTLGVAVATAGINYVVFTYWLQVPFPVSLLGF
jgi:putative tricarboxylic transport membrane protein